MALIDTTSLNRESYNICAENYHSKFIGNDIYKKHAVKFAGYLRHGENLLDLGCGSGINSKIFSNYGLKVTGVDISESMIDIAKKHSPKGNFFAGDIKAYRSEIKFDAVAAAFCIVHLNSNDAKMFLKRISDFMNKGSYLYLCFMEGKTEGFEKTSFSDKEIYFNYFDSGRIKKELEENGFDIIETNFEDYPEEDGSITKDVFMILRYKAE